MTGWLATNIMFRFVGFQKAFQHWYKSVYFIRFHRPFSVNEVCTFHTARKEPRPQLNLIGNNLPIIDNCQWIIFLNLVSFNLYLIARDMGHHPPSPRVVCRLLPLLWTPRNIATSLFVLSLLPFSILLLQLVILFCLHILTLPVRPLLAVGTSHPTHHFVGHCRPTPNCWLLYNTSSTLGSNWKQYYGLIQRCIKWKIIDKTFFTQWQ
jgi:hypothetical protein